MRIKERRFVTAVLLVGCLEAAALPTPAEFDPEYPYEARRQKMTGEGIVAMTVDPVTGHVRTVSGERDRQSSSR